MYIIEIGDAIGSHFILAESQEQAEFMAKAYLYSKLRNELHSLGQNVEAEQFSRAFNLFQDLGSELEELVPSPVRMDMETLIHRLTYDACWQTQGGSSVEIITGQTAWDNMRKEM